MTISPLLELFLVIKDLSLRAYYVLRPTLPQALRMAIRRFLAKRSLRLFANSWPINQLAGMAPGWWTGWPDGKKLAFAKDADDINVAVLENF